MTQRLTKIMSIHNVTYKTADRQTNRNIDTTVDTTAVARQKSYKRLSSLRQHRY